MDTIASFDRKNNIFDRKSNLIKHTLLYNISIVLRIPVVSPKIRIAASRGVPRSRQ